METTSEQPVVVPGFHIVRPIARGGMGEVFEAVRMGPGGFRKSVAIKQLVPSAALSENARRRFLQEAQISARLDHPNIVRVYDLLAVDSNHYLVMELLRGRDLPTLRRQIDVAPFPCWIALSIAVQVLDGLAYAHGLEAEDGRRLGLVHRDLTPCNLFVCEDGVVKILDFGVAKLRDAPTLGLTRDGYVAGTTEYLSPEQWHGGDVDARSDLHQLAATMYFLLCGMPPANGGTTGGSAELRSHIPLSVARPDLPQALAAVVERALEFDPARRFQDAVSMRDTLQQFLLDCPEGGQEALARVCRGARPSTSAPGRGQKTAAEKRRPMPLPPPQIDGDPLIGRTLGDFIIREKIGAGGFGVVYRAEQPLLEREAALKILHGRHRAHEPVAQRFIREARLASQLDHPYAAHIYSFGAEADGLLWIAMELVRGSGLDELLSSQGPMRLERFVPLLERVSEVVHCAHERGVVHRDIKPSNVIVLSRAGRLLPKLLDFGIARPLVDGGSPELAVLPPRDAPVAGDLTQRGVMVGSPHYMAPEQWIRPSHADARSDIYALAVLCYQALTGRRPFDGHTLYEVAAAHASAIMPPLGGGLPPALEHVLRRALAKKAADRYPSALEFAASFREAAGFSSERANLPQLEEGVREAVINGAPQPIAEAVAALEAASNAHQARDAMWQVASTLVRYVGVVALASRARVGPGGREDAEPVARLLRELYRRQLGDAEWVDLVRGLCKPFSERPDVYPIPELVELLSDPGAFADLFEPAQEIGNGSAEERVRTQLVQGLLRVGALLRRCAFLSEYQLVVRDGQRAQRWMGVRRTQRAVIDLHGDSQPSGDVGLVNREGAPVLDLWPFAQVDAPAPGAPDELFVFAGKGRSGAKFVAVPAGFERHDEVFWEWFGAHLLDSEEVRTQSTIAEQEPYRGLATFNAEDAALFFGREREIETGVNRLHSQALLAVVGPSGVGKSSFVQAGLIPALGVTWRALTVRPGATPLTALGARLFQERIAAADIRSEIERYPDALGVHLRAAAAATGQSLLLVVDQFEELFTLCGDANERKVYAEAVARAARTPDERVRVVITLRDDFLMRAQQLPALREKLPTSLQLLGTPAIDDLLHIVAEPARRGGFAFEDAELPAEMARAVADHPGALALLSFAAAKLWELRDRQFKQLTRKAYRSLGGVGGALAQHAETVLTGMAPPAQRQVREAFRHLVTSEGTRAVLAHSDMVEMLGAGAPAEAVVEQLVAARLLVATEDASGEDQVEIIHEALLTAWPRLVDWRREDLQGARMHEQLRSAARQWEERGRPRGLLWRGEALSEYQIWRSRHAGHLTSSEQAFASASERDAVRGLRWRGLMLIAGFTALVGGLAGVQTQRSRAEENARRAQERLSDLHLEHARESYLHSDFVQAAHYLADARNQGMKGPDFEYLVGRIDGLTGAQMFSLDGHRGPVFAAQLSPDGQRAVTAGHDGTARIWDASTGKLVRVLEGHQKLLSVARFNRDATLILTASFDGTAKLWSVSSGLLVHTLVGHKGELRGASFSPDGTRVLTQGQDATAKVWDTATGRLLCSLDGHARTVDNAEFSPDGNQIVTASWDGTARIWNTHRCTLLATLRGHSNEVPYASFSPDGTRVVTASMDRTAKVWSTASGRLLFTLEGHSNGLWMARFSPDGKRIVTTSTDHTARVWDANGGHPLATLVGHVGNVVRADFCSDGEKLVTASFDGTAKTWELKTGRLKSTLVGHRSRLWEAFFDRSCHRIITSGDDGTAKLWSADEDRLDLSLWGHRNWVTCAGASSDGARISTASTDGTLRVWDGKTGATLKTFLQPWAHEESFIALPFVRFAPRGTRIITGAGSSAVIRDSSGRDPLHLQGHRGTVTFATFSPDGRRVVTAAKDDTARIWDASSGALIRVLSGHTDDLTYATFSSDGGRILTASQDRTARIWDADSGRLIRTLSGHLGFVMSADFSPDGSRVLTASDDGTARIWDASTGAILLSLDGHHGEVRHASWSHDGRLIVTASRSGTRVWGAVSGRLLDVIEGADRWAEFTADDHIITAGSDGSTRVWNLCTSSGNVDRQMARLAEITK